MEKATRSILVIEDDKATLNKIKNQLKELNYKVACVMTAQEGVDYCIKNIVDLILLDLGLPDKDGMYVIETVRSFNNTLPIIVVSGRTTTESKVLALDAGANDYMTKPFSMDELLARIRKELRNTYTEEKHLFINGNLTIDYDAKTIFVNGVEVHFTNFEFKIVTLLNVLINFLIKKGGFYAQNIKISISKMAIFNNCCSNYYLPMLFTAYVA